ncbi:MAG: alpha/beta hydrolase [Deltaproteobacteria bacterium]|nr:alpha/beta hydrolase [Deltaproteobacteria bacterium]
MVSATPPGLPPAAPESSIALHTRDGLVLEALEHRPALERARGRVVVCHPHPLHAGTMHNKVVTTVVRAAAARDLATVRFNFRGVGGSQGTHDEGAAERLDVLAALARADELSDHRGMRVLAGYSFGSAVSCAVLAGGERVDRLLLVAPPLDVRAVPPPPLPAEGLLLVVADDDPFCSVTAAERFVASYGDARVRLQLVPGAGHFFHGLLQPLAEAVGAFLGPRDDVLS